jgi:YgiT-type zinc finger domain-containing protein
MVKRGTMRCDVCGKRGAHLRRITRSIGSGRSLLLIEGVPVVSCPHCGESYLTAETLDEIERLQKQRKKVGVVKRVLVAKFQGAA